MNKAILTYRTNQMGHQKSKPPLQLCRPRLSRSAKQLQNRLRPQAAVKERAKPSRNPTSLRRRKKNSKTRVPRSDFGYRQGCSGVLPYRNRSMTALPHPRHERRRTAHHSTLFRTLHHRAVKLILERRLGLPRCQTRCKDPALLDGRRKAKASARPLPQV